MTVAKGLTVMRPLSADNPASRKGEARTRPRPKVAKVLPNARTLEPCDPCASDATCWARLHRFVLLFRRQ